MIKSMTGYGFSSKNNNNYSIEVETKSLNSKYFDLNLKSNFEIGKIENEIRNYVKRKLLRGKIEINIIVTQPIADEPTANLQGLFCQLIYVPIE